MSETQREPVPLDDGGELETALAFLRFARHCVVKKCDGLDDEQVRRRLVPSGTTLLGLVAHLTASEHYWFGWHVAGEGGDEDDTDFEPDVDVLTTAEVLAAYDRACAHSDEVVERLGIGALTARPVRDASKTVRWVLAHMTSETARHAGHADILREQIDGVTGR